MWNARTKDELIIEVWEKLDCESVGAAEIEAIETAVAAEYGQAAVDSPMRLARLLADEGADLRHSEIMTLYVERASDRPYDAALRNVLRLDDLPSALSSIRDLENLRKKYILDNDKEGLRQIRETALAGKRDVNAVAESPKTDAIERQVKIEISQWLSLWLQTPEIFADWVDMRQNAKEFVEKFGKIGRE